MSNSETNHFWLASSSVPEGILAQLFLAMMMNRFLGRSKYWGRYLQPRRQGDPVFEMLMKMVYSEFPFVNSEFRLRLMSWFGLTIFLVNSLMLPGVRLNCPVNLSFFQTIDRVKRGFLSPPHQIERALAMLSYPFFQTPPFHLRFSIEGFFDWDDQLKLNLMKYLLLSIPAHFNGLPEFLVLVRQLILTENPFWERLVDVFIFYYLDNLDQDKDEETCPSALQYLLTDIESSSGSQDLHEFARLFKPAGNGQVLVPDDRDSFLQVIEQFVTCMIQNLPSLPGIRFEDNMIVFSPRTQLSPEGLALSARIRQILRKVHSLKISENLINLLSNKNFKDSDECLAYRGFEILLKMLQLIQKSNGSIYTLIHAHILGQTSARPDERRELCAMQDLFNLVHVFVIDNGDDDFEKYINITFSMHSYLYAGDDIIPFLMAFLLSPNFLQTLEDLLLCGDDSDLENFAQNFMENSEFVELFVRYIHEKKKTWCKA